jgi:HK97 family phage prohead protease
VNVRLRHAPVELRAEEGDPEGVLRGYASVYDVQYRIGWGLKEEIAPNCFARSIADHEGIVPIFYQHDWDNPIGYAMVSEDAKGLKVEAHLFIAENERARSVWLAAKAKALREWSIGFYPGTIETRFDEESGVDIERIIDGDLAEASVVVRGANPMTEMLDVRSRAARSKLKPVADALRSKLAAKLATRDSDADEDPGAVAQALDAVIDLIFDEVAEGEMDPESLVALLTALDVLVDRLLELLGVDDPGEEDDATETSPWAYMNESVDSLHVRAWFRESHETDV